MFNQSYTQPTHTTQDVVSGLWSATCGFGVNCASLSSSSPETVTKILIESKIVIFSNQMVVSLLFIPHNDANTKGAA